MRKSYSIFLISLIFIGTVLINCKSKKTSTPKKIEIQVEAENLNKSSVNFEIYNSESKNAFIKANSSGWIAFDVNIPVAGRYKSQVKIKSLTGSQINCWIEDYYDNKDDRTYNITGNILVNNLSTYSKDGSPLNKGLHKMKLHFNDSVNIDWIKFSLLKKHQSSPKTMTQKMDGSEWRIVWADEFEGTEIDSKKWTYDIGNWGWGNGEEQYYTENRKENARIEDGNLIMEARRNDMGKSWTSARLTTRGKTSFLYGKIEFRAKVPFNKGNWSAGWLLGDDYIDELSWPYCGEIDILESVGYEMDDETGNGIAHASTHSRAGYFKLGNQPTNTIALKNMSNKYHIYAVEWTPDKIRVLVDDNHYFTYLNIDTMSSWPFNKPQNIILNLTIGGGWGGYYGIDKNTNSQKMVIDYVRVYERD
jgi:beta-glucanase (GH16 family)